MAYPKTDDETLLLLILPLENGPDEAEHPKTRRRAPERRRDPDADTTDPEDDGDEATSTKDATGPILPRMPRPRR